MQESESPPVPEDDDLNATVIEVMTDVEVLLDGSSVIDVFAVNSARRKRVEVSERTLTESDRKLCRKAEELELQFGLITECLIWLKRVCCSRERVMCSWWVLTWKSTGKAKARLCVFVLRKSGKIHGVLGVHVDVIGGGNETFDRIMTTVAQRV